MWNGKRHKKANIILKNKVRRFTLPDFKTLYKTMVIKTEWYWPKDKNKDQQNRIKSPEADLHKYS